MVTAEEGRVVRVGLFSMRGAPFALEENYRRIDGYVRQAAAAGATLVVTPEGALDGYVCTKALRARQMRTVAQPVPDGPYLLRARTLCRQLGISLVLGFLEAGGGGGRTAMRNSCVLIDPNGEVTARFSKLFPQSEQWVWAGREMPVASSAIGRLGMLICADRTVSPHFAPYAAADIDAVVIPMDGGGGPVNTRVMQQRAREGGHWVLIANTWSRVAVAPSGEVQLAEYHTEGVSVCDLPKAQPGPAHNDGPPEPVPHDRIVTATTELMADRWDATGAPRRGERRARRVARRVRRQFLSDTDRHLASEAMNVGDGLIDLNQSAASDSGIAHVLRFAEVLQHLTLRGCKLLTDACAESLAALTELRVLDLQGTAVGDAGARRLSACRQLRLLDLSATLVTGEALAVLAELPELTRLRLVGCKLREETLSSLASFPALRWLDVSAGLLTSRTLAEVCAKRPELVVEFEQLRVRAAG